MDEIFDNITPIFVQIENKIKADILCGKLKSGEKMESIRELAIKLKVNPNTLQKALAELEEQGLIFTERTNGKYVTQDEQLISAMRDNIAQECLKKYIQDMEKIGYNKEMAIKFATKKGDK